MLIFAVSAMEKLRNVPLKNLANLGLVILAVIVAVILIKMAARMNKIFLFMILALIVIVVGFTWVYQRTEPKFLTPVVDRIAPFFPSAPTPYSQRPAPGTERTAAPKNPAPPPEPKSR